MPFLLVLLDVLLDVLGDVLGFFACFCCVLDVGKCAGKGVFLLYFWA